jgi:curved DNA-binding protein CbpA
MKTLYDLLGARRSDNAAHLHAAFRKAVKAAHPDVNPADPEAALRFRQLVRANTILSDTKQRAVYDGLLAAAEHPVRAFVGDTIRKLASDIIAVVILSAVLAGGYVLLWPSVRSAAAPAGGTDVIVRHDAAAVTAKPESVQAVAALPSLPRAANDANSYRARGLAAYRDGDLARALADFDLAIQLDPTLADSYLDRGIVFYRMHSFDRAFADVAEARRIDRLSMPKAQR